MPLIIDGGRIPPRWAARKNIRPADSIESFDRGSKCARIAFVNNMPDPALEDTEMQFFDLLDSSAAGVPVRLKLFALPGVPRAERAKRHLASFYSGINDLLTNRFDGLIMTGTEPRQPDLHNEPYWAALTTVLDWAETNTASTILSCLAAHAGVLYSDGIGRQPLGDKQFGVFEFTKTVNHQLTAGTTDPVRFPHSRWNEVRADALASSGYTVLTQAPGGGVDSFAKKKKKSLFVHFQGHPEYGVQTLLKEYLRDIKRFIRRERETYPSAPEGYFDPSSTRLLADFRHSVVTDRREEIMESFPEATLVGSLQNTWRSSAEIIYKNWLQHVLTKRADAAVFPASAVTEQRGWPKRSAFL